MSRATFAGGCFWCMVPPFKERDDVKEVVSGYSKREEGESEAVQITFEGPYEDMLEVFWRHIDPTDEGGQFFDRGIKYKTAIFYHDENQKKLALQSKEELQKHFDKPIVTDILPFISFKKAKEGHQDFYKKHPLRYKMYKMASGRESYLKKAWGD